MSSRNADIQCRAITVRVVDYSRAGAMCTRDDTRLSRVVVDLLGGVPADDDL